MGKVVWQDPLTYMEIIDHPFLNISSSYASLKTEVADWLKDNFGLQGTDWDFTFTDGDYVLLFKSEEKKTWFLIRWS